MRKSADSVTEGFCGVNYVVTISLIGCSFLGRGFEPQDRNRTRVQVFGQ
ncbi:protein of unknown function [Shewanella benthica]|uniref:Lipoprotein n=1 Tax=Shewanella benthica TaxID=43661 RepID=A0A330M9G6_9GAMM|nr:protein of unknown function [Shewanella benthica]